MYNRNINCPKTLPWRTPDKKPKFSDVTPSLFLHIYQASCYLNKCQCTYSLFIKYIIYII